MSGLVTDVAAAIIAEEQLSGVSTPKLFEPAYHLNYSSLGWLRKRIMTWSEGSTLLAIIVATTSNINVPE